MRKNTGCFCGAGGGPDPGGRKLKLAKHIIADKVVHIRELLRNVITIPNTNPFGRHFRS